MLEGEGAGDTARTEGVEWTGSGEEEVALLVTGVLDVGAVAALEDTTMAGTTGELFLSSGVAGLRGSFTLSSGTGEEVR